MTGIATGSAARYAGTRVQRVEDARLLTGHGTYVDDVVVAARVYAAAMAQGVGRTIEW